MRIYALIILFFLIIGDTFSQVHTNPFEIESRLDSVYNSEGKEESSTLNVFDVQRSDDKAANSTIITPVDTTGIDEESDLMPSVGEEDGEEEFLDKNPFDVSHIPIRKSKLKKEADAFKAKKSKESDTTGSNAFLFWLNLLTALILAIVINTQRGAIKKTANAITNENVLKLIHREEKRGISGYNILLYASYFINIAIFVYLILYNFFKVQGWWKYQLIFISILGLYLLRHLFLFVAGRIFPFRKDSQLYGFTIQTFNIFLGIILVPFNLIIAFGPENAAIPLIYITLVIIGILALLRTFRGFLIASTYVQSNLFHFLLYLCTFEILPILLLIKIIGNFEIA